MAGKSPEAFRTISEVADWLERPAHVLRFWESKFTQVKPVKRAGGRRYYRPEDMLLLGGIKKLLHDDGMTIKGAQKIMREQGVRYVSALSQPLDDDTAAPVVAASVTAAVANRDTAPDAIPVAKRVTEPAHDTSAASPAPRPPAPASPPVASVAEKTVADSPDIAQAHNAPVDSATQPPDPADALPDREPAPLAVDRPQASPESEAPDIGRPPVASTPRAPLGADIPQTPVADNAPHQPGVLALIAALQGSVSSSHRASLLPILDRLDKLGARMGAARKG
ncbi:MerR family transcriptional regulator [Seohaeicola saemankumensis]|uniref:MerR family transcriptional regulator n=1 Tax=Seohaeicola saemankumensis TaxID=481181 RepID=UPI001E58103D|nr:MerR family transcriptional regulator [Seohaeicola saemankumensis]